jgi:carbonic anhydrase/acetyltransferase-like protein (isoleucine patch superfamily)
MRARILTTDHVLPPWGDRPADWHVLLRPAAEWTREALAEVGIELDAGSDPPAAGTLLLSDDVLVSPEFLRDFAAIASTRPDAPPLVACLGPGFAASRSAGRAALKPGPDGSLPIPMVLWQGSQDRPPSTPNDLLALAEGAEPVVVDPQQSAHELPVPRAYADPGKETMTVAGSTRIALHLRHRSHLLQANSEMLGASFLRTLGGAKWKLASRWLWGKLRPGPRRMFSRIGKGCKIDPTAIVEGCQLGDGCEVGAHAILRAAVLGEGVSIEDGAHVQMSVLDDRSRVGRQTALLGCVLMEGAHSSQRMMQFATLGRHTATTAASWFMDTRFDGKNITVEAPPGDPAKILDAGTRFLACDVGHGTIVGANILLAAGRMLPGHALITCDPKMVLSKIDGAIDPTDAGGAMLVVRDGKLEPAGD